MHTVEKIGGSSLSEFGTVMSNVIIGDRKADDLYQRIFVVSAYGGITNLLLEHKKSGNPGVYAYYAEQDPKWQDALTDVAKTMCEINAGLADIGLDVEDADRYVNERLEGIKHCLKGFPPSFI